MTPENREIRDAILNAWNGVIMRFVSSDAAPQPTAFLDQWQIYQDLFMMIGNATGVLIAQVANNDANRKWLTNVVVNNIPLGCASYDMSRSASKNN